MWVGVDIGQGHSKCIGNKMLTTGDFGAPHTIPNKWLPSQPTLRASTALEKNYHSVSQHFSIALHLECHHAAPDGIEK